MGKRTGVVLLALLLAAPGLLFTAGCSKKRVKSDEPIMTDDRRPGGVEEEELSAEERVRRESIRERELREQRERARMAARSAFVNQDIYFDFDDSTLRGEAQAVLRQKAEFMRENPGISVVIEGHCDERGTAEYNIALGERRAEAAKSFLVNLGISGSRMTTVSYGEEKPIDPGHNEQAWARNRRGHFEIR